MVGLAGRSARGCHRPFLCARCSGAIPGSFQAGREMEQAAGGGSGPPCFPLLDRPYLPPNPTCLRAGVMKSHRCLSSWLVFYGTSQATGSRCSWVPFPTMTLSGNLSFPPASLASGSELVLLFFVFPYSAFGPQHTSSSQVSSCPEFLVFP